MAEGLIAVLATSLTAFCVYPTRKTHAAFDQHITELANKIRTCYELSGHFLHNAETVADQCDSLSSLYNENLNRWDFLDADITNQTNHVALLTPEAQTQFPLSLRMLDSHHRLAVHDSQIVLEDNPIDRLTHAARVLAEMQAEMRSLAASREALKQSVLALEDSLMPLRELYMEKRAELLGLTCHWNGIQSVLKRHGITQWRHLLDDIMGEQCEEDGRDREDWIQVVMGQADEVTAGIAQYDSKRALFLQNGRAKMTGKKVETEKVGTRTTHLLSSRSDSRRKHKKPRLTLEIPKIDGRGDGGHFN